MKSDQNNTFFKENLICKSDSMKSKAEITGSEKQSINAGSEKMSVDTTTLNVSENATRKQGDKPANLAIKTDVEIAEIFCHESFDNQLLRNNELAVTNDVENIVKCKKSQKRDKKIKKKSRESFTDSLNGSNLDGISGIRSEASTEKNKEPLKKKHKKSLVNDNEVSSENKKEEKKRKMDEMSTKGIGLSAGVDDAPQITSEANTVKKEKQQKKEHKRRKMDKMRGENDSVELAYEVMTGGGISLSEVVDTTPEIRTETNTVENEESPKKKHKRKMNKKRAVNDTELLCENNLEANLHPSVCNPNATTNLELATEAMIVGGISLPKGADDTPEIRLEADTVESGKSLKKKHKKRKTDNGRAANDIELLSENNREAYLYPSVCNPNATINSELTTEAIVDRGISLSKGADDTPEIRSEANIVKKEEPKKKKRKKRKMDKNSAANDSEPLGENKSEGKYYPSVCDPNATTDSELATQNMTADGIRSAKVVDDDPEIRSEANTVNSENPQKKKRKKKIKSSVASGSGALDNNLKENIPPSMEVYVSNASINIDLANKNSEEASQSVSQQLPANETPSKCANDSLEVDLVSNALENDGPQKKMEHEEMTIDGQAFGDNGLEVKNIGNILLQAIGNEIHTPRRFGRRKLLVLDLNGLLCEVTKGTPRRKKQYEKFGRFAVFKRPFCDDFMKFCCENFDIGVWSSRKAENVDGVVNIVMKDFKDDLLFCWSQSECTCTPHKSIENHNKPIVLKKLQKIWNKEEGNLPWELGDYSPSNTLLIDDSPYKALCNPPYTGVFPYAYNHRNERDNALGPGGSLRVYLEGLALAEDVESYVREHPFGRPAITSANPSWRFYEKIINEYNK